MEFIQRFNTAEIRKIDTEATNELIRAACEGRKPQPHSVLPLLDFYEEVALAVLNDLADEDHCPAFLRPEHRRYLQSIGGNSRRSP